MHGQRMKATHGLPGSAHGAHFRRLGAYRGCVRASLAKRAPGRKIEQRWRHAGNLLEPTSAFVVRRHRVEQPLRVWVHGMPQHLRARALLDDAPGVHHAHAIGEPGDDREVMRDPDERRAAFAGQLLHFIQDLTLDRYIERGGRLVGDDEIGAVEQRDGDGHPLPHAAGKLMRIGYEPLVRRWNADADQRLAGAGTRDVLAHLPVREDRLDHLHVDAQDRIERHHRVLEDHRHAVAAHVALRFRIQCPQVDAVEDDAAADDSSGRIDQAHERITGHRLAGARLAYEPQHLAAIDGERDVVDGLDDACLGEEMRAQAFDDEDRFVQRLAWLAHRCKRGLSTSRN